MPSPSELQLSSPRISRTPRRPRARTDDARVRNTAEKFSHYLTRPILTLGPMAFSLAVSAVIILSWIERDEGHITAESGVGYWLGIAGATVMLLLILYPMRKRYKFLHGIGRVANWFRTHMVLGILGPTLVILHTNFKLGSLNSRLALFTMLVVVASGIVGRFLYAKVHKGLYGKQAEMRDVLADISDLQAGIGRELAGHDAIVSELETYARRTPEARGVFALLIGATAAGARTNKVRRRILRESRRHYAAAGYNLSRRQVRQQVRTIDQHLRIFFAAVKKAERLALFERLFAMWHHLHVPLFALLAVTVTVHVIAVHLY